MLRTIHAILFTLFLVLSLSLSLPKPAAKPGVRSTELQKVVTVEGDTYRVDYMQNGVVTKPANLRYATLVKTRTGDRVLEEYFDASGDPARQSSGHCALLREYDRQGRNYKVTFLDAQGEPMINYSGYSVLFRLYSKEGKLQFERYYDLEGQLVSGRYYRYEGDGSTLLTYLDRNAQPDLRRAYPILQQFFYKCGPHKGKVERETYLDQDGLPVSLSSGQSGQRREYDDLGRTAVLTYLDQDGNPMLTSSGYATVKRTFSPSDSVTSERYYDTQGQPIASSSNHYGYRYANGKTVYLDAQGRDIFDFHDFLYGTPLAVTLMGLLVAGLALFLDKRGNLLLLVLYLLFIAQMTLLGRRYGVHRDIPSLFWSYRQFFTHSGLQREILYNIWLFFPLGAILCRLRPEKKTLWAVFLLSLLIETIQLGGGLGLAEFDDLISNTLGGFLGFGLIHALRPKQVTSNST